MLSSVSCDYSSVISYVVEWDDWITFKSIFRFNSLILFCWQFLAVAKHGSPISNVTINVLVSVATWFWKHFEFSNSMLQQNRKNRVFLRYQAWQLLKSISQHRALVFKNNLQQEIVQKLIFLNKSRRVKWSRIESRKIQLCTSIYKQSEENRKKKFCNRNYSRSHDLTKLLSWPVL